jgi:septum site-determining protein MinD
MGSEEREEMTGKVVTVTSGKGGVGKTTATANVGAALASTGQKVVCIDADIGLRNLDVVMGLENRIVYDLVNVIEGSCRLRQALIRDKRLPDLFLIPAAQTRDKSAVSPSDMVRLCDDLRPEFDWIMIDSPAGIERGFRNAVAPADIVLVITNPEISAVRDADRIIGLVEAEEMVRRGDMLTVEDVIELLAVELLGMVPDDENVLLSTNRGTPVVLDGKSKAGQAFRNISRRLQGEQVPFMSLDDEGGFLGRLTRFIRPGGS